jgi:hypothetical protein
MEAIRCSETSVYTRYTRRHIQEDGILHSHRCENLKSYKVLSVVHLSIYGSTVLFCWMLAVFQFLHFIHSRQDSLDGGSAFRKTATYIHRITQTQNKCKRYICLEWDSNPRSQAFERAKTVHALDRAVTVIGMLTICQPHNTSPKAREVREALKMFLTRNV